MALEIGFVDDVQAKFVAEVVEARFTIDASIMYSYSNTLTYFG